MIKKKRIATNEIGCVEVRFKLTRVVRMQQESCFALVLHGGV